MKKMLLVGLMILLLATTVCLPGYAKEQIELRVSWWGSQARHDRTLAVIEMFEAKYPHITVEPEFAGWDNFWERIAAQVAAGRTPDVLQHDYSLIGQYVQRGLLADLTPFVESGILNIDDIDEATIASGSIDDGLYGISLGSNSIGGIYDPTLFEAAGLAEPSPDWTWDEYMEISRTLHETLGIYSCGRFFAGEAPFHGLQHYLRQRGYAIYSEDGNALGYDDDNLFAEFFAMQLALVKEGVVPGVAERSEVTGVETELLASGEAAMAWLWSNNIVAMSVFTDRPLRMALVPKDPAQVQEGQYIKPSQFFTVAESSPNKEAAALFIDFVTNDVEANKVLMGERGVPVSAKVREALRPFLNDAMVEAFDFVDLAIQHSSRIEPPEPAGNAEVVRLLESLEEMIMLGVVTPEEAAKTFRAEATRILQKQ